MSQNGLGARIERERAAHEDDDVLAKSAELKGRFSHILTSPSARALEHDFAAEMNAAAGKTVLDYGCGRGEHALTLLRSGARKVVGIDISRPYVQQARQAAADAGYPSEAFEFQTMDAHALTFDDGAFDLVIGSGILHHLDLPLALDEVFRVLKPGGRAIFVEPLGGSPLFKVFRYLTPKARTEDERPLFRRDLQLIARKWDVRHSFYGLLCAPVAVVTSILLRPFPNNFVLAMAFRIERFFARYGLLNTWHQYVLLRAIKPARNNAAY